MPNTTNELTVLYSILNDNSLMENLDLTVNDFTTKANKQLFKNMKMQYDEDGCIELKELLGDLDPKYVNDYQEKIESESVGDISRCVKRMKEVSKKQAIEEALSKIIHSLDGNLNSATAIAELGILVNELEKKSSQAVYSLDIRNLSEIVVEKPDFFLKDFLPLQKNEINLISASGGTGKSYLGVLLLSMLHKRYENLNIFAWFSEDTAGFVKDRANQLKELYKDEIDINFDVAGKGSALSFVDKGKNGNLQASKFFEFFKKQVQGYSVLLLDPLIQFMSNIDENNNGEVRFFFNLLNTWCEEEGKTLIIIHHHNKGSIDADGNKTTSVRGASAIIDAVRVHYSLSSKNPLTIATKKKKGDVPMKQKSDGFVYCVKEKANHFKSDDIYKIRLFKEEQSAFKPLRNNQENLKTPVIINKEADIDVYDFDEIPF